MRRNLAYFMVFAMVITSLMSIQTAQVFGMAPERGVIQPGEGVDGLRIGDMPSREMLLSLEKRRVIVKTSVSRTGQRVVETIKVLSPDFQLVRSQLRVRYNTLGDVLRFYGAGDEKIDYDRVVLSYPREGIAFEIDKKGDRIESITVFRPMRPRVPVEQYDRYRDQLRQRPLR